MHVAAFDEHLGNGGQVELAEIAAGHNAIGAEVVRYRHAGREE